MPPNDQFRRMLTDQIQQGIERCCSGITPLVDVTVLAAPHDAAGLDR